MFVICLFFYADLLTYKITPIIDLCFSFFISQYISQKYKISQCEFFPISCSPSVYPCSSQKTGGDNYPSSIFLINHLFIHSLTALIDAFPFFPVLSCILLEVTVQNCLAFTSSAFLFISLWFAISLPFYNLIPSIHNRWGQKLPRSLVFSPSILFLQSTFKASPQRTAGGLNAHALANRTEISERDILVLTSKKNSSSSH